MKKKQSLSMTGSIGLPGGANEIKFSMTGYKSTSADRFNPYNVIPSNHITMQGVPHPVFGVDDQGNSQMMYPGQDYMFPGSMVTEYPMMQAGGNSPFVGGDAAYNAYEQTHLTNKAAEQDYLQKKAAYEAEVARVTGATKNLLKLAEQKDINNTPTRLKINVKQGEHYCNTHTCELMRDAGYTVPMSTPEQKRWGPGDAFPIIPGNIKMKGNLEKLGFIPVAEGDTRAGDFSQEEIFKDHDYQGNTFTPRWVPSHSTIHTGKSNEQGNLYYNAPGGLRNNYAKTNISLGNPNEYRMQSWRYVGDQPQLEQEMIAAQNAYAQSRLQTPMMPKAHSLQAASIPTSTISKPAQINMDAEKEKMIAQVENSNMSKKEKKIALEQIAALNKEQPSELVLNNSDINSFAYGGQPCYECGGAHMEYGGGIPAGYHMMPNGTIMPNSAHMKKIGNSAYKNYMKQFGGDTTNAPQNMTTNGMLDYKKNMFKNKVSKNVFANLAQEEMNNAVNMAGNMFQIGGSVRINNVDPYAEAYADMQGQMFDDFSNFGAAAEDFGTQLAFGPGEWRYKQKTKFTKEGREANRQHNQIMNNWNKNNPAYFYGGQYMQQGGNTYSIYDNPQATLDSLNQARKLDDKLTAAKDATVWDGFRASIGLSNEGKTAGELAALANRNAYLQSMSPELNQYYWDHRKMSPHNTFNSPTRSVQPYYGMMGHAALAGSNAGGFARGPLTVKAYGGHYLPKAQFGPPAGFTQGQFQNPIMTQDPRPPMYPSYSERFPYYAPQIGINKPLPYQYDPADAEEIRNQAVINAINAANADLMGPKLGDYRPYLNKSQVSLDGGYDYLNGSTSTVIDENPVVDNSTDEKEEKTTSEKVEESLATTGGGDGKTTTTTGGGSGSGTSLFDDQTSGAGTTTSTTGTGSEAAAAALNRRDAARQAAGNEQPVPVSDGQGGLMYMMPSYYNSNRGFGYGPGVAYNAAQTYLDEYDYRGRLFGQGPRRVKMKFSHYGQPMMQGTPQGGGNFMDQASNIFQGGKQKVKNMLDKKGKTEQVPQGETPTIQRAQPRAGAAQPLTNIDTRTGFNPFAGNMPLNYGSNRVAAPVPPAATDIYPEEYYMSPNMAYGGIVYPGGRPVHFSQAFFQDGGKVARKEPMIDAGVGITDIDRTVSEIPGTNPYAKTTADWKRKALGLPYADMALAGIDMLGSIGQADERQAMKEAMLAQTMADASFSPVGQGSYGTTTVNQGYMNPYLQNAATQFTGYNTGSIGSGRYAQMGGSMTPQMGQVTSAKYGTLSPAQAALFYERQMQNPEYKKQIAMLKAAADRMQHNAFTSAPDIGIGYLPGTRPGYKPMQQMGEAGYKPMQQMGGAMNVGDEMYLSDDEIQAIMQAGGTVEFID